MSKKLGRPAININLLKENRVVIRLNESDKEKFKAAASDVGMTESEFGRKLLKQIISDKFNKKQSDASILHKFSNY
jgi:predicted DNA binding CopG/RHH family protein